MNGISRNLMPRYMPDMPQVLAARHTRLACLTGKLTGNFVRFRPSCTIFRAQSASEFSVCR